VRGVTFQPIQDAGRNDGFDPKQHRIVLTEVRRRIAEAGVFALATGYSHRRKIYPRQARPWILLRYELQSITKSAALRLNLRIQSPFHFK